MHLVFSDKEKEWLDMKSLNWKPKENCPEDIKKSIENKLRLINKQKQHFRNYTK